MRLDSARRVFRSDAAVAEALGVNRTQLSRWREGRTPDPENLDRLVGLDAVVQLLTGFLSETTIPKWLRSPNPRLGDRTPLYMLQRGRLPDVIAAIQAEKSGTFA
ncbi:MAG: helix-turn-helix domain-containing protein [Longimicrobiales bacterium]